MKRMLGEPSWRLSSASVQAWVARTGGMVGPVTFRIGRRQWQPLHVAPWRQEAGCRSLAPVLRALRGDFFCLPFGGGCDDATSTDDQPHGSPANASWRLREQSSNRLHLSMQLPRWYGEVEKIVELRDGKPAIYQRHVVRGAGRVCFGHHAMLRFTPGMGTGLLSVSAMKFGRTHPSFEQPARGGYSSFLKDTAFDSLERVPLASGDYEDIRTYPARHGFEDILQIAADPREAFAWSAVVFPSARWVWVAIKNPRVLRQTMLWFSNGGRHYPPWSGRHVGVLGIEEVTSYFNLGLTGSIRANPFTRSGSPTFAHMTSDCPLDVRYAMGVARIPAGFDRVAFVEAVRGSVGLRLISESGKTCRLALDASFLKTEE